MRPAPVIHNLRHNRAERSPQHVVCLDTETRWHTDADGNHHTLRLWSASLLHRHANEHRNGNVARARGRTAAELADTIGGWAQHCRSLWVFMHNTDFDLGVTRLPLLLIERGWALGDHALAMTHPWCRLGDGKHTITLVDSVSVLSAPLDRIGHQLGMVKPALPDNDDSDDAWWHRCDADVDILGAAITQLLDWWDREQLGCWSLTGASTGWNAYRHMPRPHMVVIDPDAEARAFERRAVTGGRREAWKVGKQPHGRYVEIDFVRAHLTVCREFPLPRKRSLPFVGEPAESDWLDRDHWGMIADVTVSTATPRYTLRYDGRLWHPVGTFRTILCGPELHDARARGDIVKIHGGYRYWLARHMEPWARWLGGVLDDDTGETPPMAQLAGTGWSRTVPGKWATRTSRVVERLPSDVAGWAVERGIHHPSDQPSTIMHMAGEQTWHLGDVEADDGFPAVLAWIQSEVRVRLAAMIDAIGPRRLVSCNTDGVIVRAASGINLESLARLTFPLVPRVKAAYKSVTVLGPNHLELDGRPRMSGVPRRGAMKWDNAFSWHTWPSLKKQLENGSAEGYTQPPRRVDMTNVPVTRWVLRDGSTQPPAAIIDADGETRLLARDEYPLPESARALAPAQHPSLRLQREGAGEAGDTVTQPASVA